MQLTKLQIRQLATLARGHQAAAIYLFGSAAEHRATPLSDIDVAFLIEPEAYRKLANPLVERSRLVCALQKVCGTRRPFDVVLLNEAEPLLAYEVISRGRRLVVRDPLAVGLFEMAALRRYHDSAPLRAMNFYALEQRLQRHTFGVPAV